MIRIQLVVTCDHCRRVEVVDVSSVYVERPDQIETVCVDPPSGWEIDPGKFGAPSRHLCWRCARAIGKPWEGEG